MVDNNLISKSLIISIDIYGVSNNLHEVFIYSINLPGLIDLGLISYWISCFNESAHMVIIKWVPSLKLSLLLKNYLQDTQTIQLN